MALTRTQKRWAIGGSIGAGVLFLGYELFRYKEDQARSSYGTRRFHQGHVRRRHDDVHTENKRGEYGRLKHHHHKGPHHKGQQDGQRSATFLGAVSKRSW